MFPIGNNVGDDVAMLNDNNIFEEQLSDQEIDVINDDEELIPVDGDEQYQQYEERVVYEDDEMEEYEEMNPEEQQFMDNAFEPDAHTHYSVVMSKEEYEAHYLNTDVAYLMEKHGDTVYNMLDNPANIVSITKEDRLKAFPEMRMIPPCHPPRKTPREGSDPELLAEETAQLKRLHPAAAELMIANNCFPVTKRVQMGEVIEDWKDVQLVAKSKSKSAGADGKGGQKSPTIVKIAKQGYIGNAALVAAPTAKARAALEAKKKPKIYARKIYRPPPIERPEMRRDTNCYFPLTPLPDRYFLKRRTISADQAGFTSECASCHLCEMMYRNISLLETHLKKHRTKGSKPIRGMGLLCPMPSCSQRADTIATIVKHMKMAHNVADIPFERVIFKNLAEFKLWRMELERLTMSKFSRASGKTNIFSKSTYYQCQHSGIVPSTLRTPEELRKARSRMSKKLGKTCTAFFHIRENDDGTVLLRGCTKHTGHGVDVRQLPLSDEIKLEIALGLIKGYDETYICDKMRLESSNANRKFFLQPYEVRNVGNKIDRFVEDLRKKYDNGGEITDLSELLRIKLEATKTDMTHDLMPVAEDEVETVFDVTNIYPDSYFVEPVFNEEVVIEDGLFNVPAGNGVMEVTHVAPKMEVSPLPNENFDTDSVEHEKILNAVKLSPPEAIQETPRKRARFDSEEGPSTSAPQPTRYSSRLLKKKTRHDFKTEDDADDLQYQNPYQDNQLVGDDVDYDSGMD